MTIGVKPQHGIILFGMDPSGNVVQVNVDANGNLAVSANGGGSTDLGFVASGTTDLTSALGLAALPVGSPVAIPAGATVVTIRPETGDVRWRSDGTNPVAGTGGGNLLKAGETLTFAGTLSAIKFINDVAANNAVLLINYWK